MDSQWRQSCGWIYLHLHFTPLAVAGQVLGVVADYILVAQLGGNLLCDITHLGDIVHAEQPPAGLFAQIVEKLWTGALFRRRCVRVEDSNRINLYIRLPHLRSNLAFCIPGAVVASI